ncbi:MAG: adenylyltransferase [Anaerolinea sp.]|nr:adenylyltransferase [Anaerolinea sp.]
MKQKTTVLTDYDLCRYSRQMMLAGWGEDGQKKIKNSSVFIAGAGGLGSPVALYLAAAGLGEISICDDDTVELSNLNRQILHSDNRLGQLKALSAEQTLREINPSLSLHSIAERLDENNVERIVGKPNIVVDCLDNYPTRYLLNTYCVNHNIPLVHAAIWGLIGQIAFIKSPETPCLQCIIPEAPPKDVFPVLGATSGVIGALQAMETLKYLTGIGELLMGRLLLFDGENMSFENIKVNHRPECSICGVESKHPNL